MQHLSRSPRTPAASSSSRLVQTISVAVSRLLARDNRASDPYYLSRKFQQVGRCGSGDRVRDEFISSIRLTGGARSRRVDFTQFHECGYVSVSLQGKVFLFEQIMLHR